MKFAALHDDAERAERFLKALANRQRLLVLCELYEGEKSVSDLQGCCGLGQSAMSQHLAVLRAEGIVETRRDAQTVFYRIKNPDALRLVGLLSDIFCRAPADADRTEKRTETCRSTES
jgi:ArsR family transcriptional regulator, virulence genes transcriptional regulator